MRKERITIFEFPSNLGLKKKEADSEPGVKLLPDWLKQNKFHELLAPEQVFGLIPPAYSMDIDVKSGVRNADKIVEYAKEQAHLLSEKLKPDEFFIALGGDCSILIGIALALRLKGEFALFFLDGHTDFATPEISESKSGAAMELSIVTGHGHVKLTNIFDLGPYIKPERVWCVGNREKDPAILREILNSSINYVDLEALRNMGIKNCALDFLKMVNARKLDGFFIHLDVDVLNDEIMPAVDSRSQGGLDYGELNELLGVLLGSNKAIGMEITILDPTLDDTGLYTRDFVLNLSRVIHHKIKPPPYT